MKGVLWSGLGGLTSWTFVWVAIYGWRITIAGCTPQTPAPVAPDNPTDPARDAAPAPSPTPPDDGGPRVLSACERAYQHMAIELSCDPRAPEGSPWVTACSTGRQHGLEFGLKCIGAARSCAEAHRCLAGQ